MKLCFGCMLALFMAASSALPSYDSPGASGLHFSLESALSSPELLAVAGGEVVAKVLESSDRSEIVTLAAVGIRDDASSFRACAADPSCLFGHEELIATGRFSSRPTVDDVQRLEVDSGDRERLARCRVGRCAVRLPASAIEDFAGTVAWGDPIDATQAALVFRRTVADLALRYVDEGDRALPVYDDDERGTRVADALASLLGRALPLLDQAPELRDRLRAGASGALMDAGDYLCWRQERFWRQSLTSLEHVAVHTSRGGVVLAAVKQLYASHYFDASIAVFAFVPDPSGRGGTLLHMSRARADIRPAGFTWLERVFLKRMVRGRLERHLMAIRDSLRLPHRWPLGKAEGDQALP